MAWTTSHFCAGTVGNNMRYANASSGHRRHTAVAVLLLVWFVVATAGWALVGIEQSPQHGPHGLAASAANASAPPSMDHPHLGNDLPGSPEIFAEAVLPRGTAASLALGLVATATILMKQWRGAWPTAVRGPPRRVASVLNGRNVLTRLCIARC